MLGACRHRAKALPTRELPGKAVAAFPATVEYGRRRLLLDETRAAARRLSWLRAPEELRSEAQSDRANQRPAERGLRLAFWSVHLVHAREKPGEFGLRAF